MRRPQALLALTFFSLPSSAWQTQGIPPQPDEVGVFVPSTNYTILDMHDTWRRRFHFGKSNALLGLHLPVAGDWDGDGLDTVGYFSTTEKRFYLHNRNVPGETELIVDFPGDGSALPVVGDWNGDGTTQLGIYTTDDSGLKRFILDGVTPYDVSATLSGPFRPVAGDWNGDGFETVGLFEPATGSFRLANALGDDFSTATPLPFVPNPSTTTGYPVTGDWNMNGVDTIGFYSSDGEYAVISNTNSPSNFELVHFSETVLDNFGGGQIYPIAGFWDPRGDASASSGYAWVEEAADIHVNGIDPVKLADAYDFAALNYSHLNSMLVIRDGKLIEEDHWNGYDETITNNIKSCSKSVLSALYGIAWAEGHLTSTPPPIEALQQGSTLPKQAMQAAPVRFGSPYLAAAPHNLSYYHLLTMSAGLTWSELTESSIWQGFVSSSNMPEYVILQSPVPGVDPGTQYDYSSGLTHVGSEILRHNLSSSYSSVLDFAQQRLFDRIGIEPTRWDHEPATNVIPSLEGTLHLGGWELYLRPRDLARFAQLYLDDGVVQVTGMQPDQVVPESWIDWTTVPQVSSTYGAWWRFRNFYRASDNKLFPCYYAEGYGGQEAYIFPGHGLIVVMTSKWRVTGQESMDAISDNKTILLKVLEAVDPN